MLSGDNISSSATDDGGGGDEARRAGTGARGAGRRTEAHLRREQLGGDRDAGLLRLSRGDSFHHQFRFREDVHRRSSFLRVEVGAGEAGERGFSSSREAASASAVRPFLARRYTQFHSQDLALTARP